jgi:hypothetical protein
MLISEDEVCLFPFLEYSDQGFGIPATNAMSFAADFFPRRVVSWGKAETLGRIFVSFRRLAAAGFFGNLIRIVGYP